MFLNLYLDREPFLPLILPSETIVWKDMQRLDLKGEQITQAILANELEFSIKVSKVRIPTTLKDQKRFMTTYLNGIKGRIVLSETAQNEMTIEVLSTVLYMLNHGFYENNKELKELAMPIILMLNGATDEYKTEKE